MLRYIHGFNITQFAADASSYFNLLIDFFTGTDKKFLYDALYIFISADFNDDDTLVDGGGNIDYDWSTIGEYSDEDEMAPPPDYTIEFDPDFSDEQIIVDGYYLKPLSQILN